MNKILFFAGLATLLTTGCIVPVDDHRGGDRREYRHDDHAEVVVGPPVVVVRPPEVIVH